MGSSTLTLNLKTHIYIYLNNNIEPIEHFLWSNVLVITITSEREIFLWKIFSNKTNKTFSFNYSSMWFSFNWYHEWLSELLAFHKELIQWDNNIQILVRTYHSCKPSKLIVLVVMSKNIKDDLLSWWIHLKSTLYFSKNSWNKWIKITLKLKSKFNNIHSHPIFYCSLFVSLITWLPKILFSKMKKPRLFLLIY